MSTPISVRLSAETIEILKNMSSINNSVLIKAGTRLKAMSSAQTIFIDAEIKEQFPFDFALYDLSKFLNVLSLPNFKDAELLFTEGENFLVVQNDNTKIIYFFTDPQFVIYPDKNISLPSVDLKVMLEEQDLENFMKASSVLGHKMMKFVVKDKKVKLISTSPEIDTSNDYVMEIGEVEDAADGEYSIRVDHLKIIPGSYQIEICALGISKVTSTTRDLCYYVALERV